MCGDCRACGGSNPTTDTVKVNPTLLAESCDKAPLTHDQEREAEERCRREAEEQRLREEEEERRRREVEDQRRREEEEQEQQRRAAAEERARIERETAQAQELQRIKEEAELAERRTQELRAAEEAAIKAEEDARIAEEARIVREKQDAKVEAYLKAKGFKKGINEPKKSCLSTNYALHVAVTEKNAEVVEALVVCGADTSVVNNKKLTPLQLAQKLDKKGSHMQVMTALSRSSAP